MTDVRVLTGADLVAALPDVAALRIAVFADWPYLYDGDLAYEEAYLQAYLSPGAVVVAAFDGDRMVGASTGAPMEDHAADFADALPAAYPVDRVFYCAESVLLPQYRGKGLGHAFFDAREDQARRLQRRFAMFCSVVRDPNHPDRPAAYRPLDGFWKGRGYEKIPGAFATFDWKDMGATEESTKRLQLWIKEL